jgi:hypothetical protein
MSISDEAWIKLIVSNIVSIEDRNGSNSTRKILEDFVLLYQIELQRKYGAQIEFCRKLSKHDPKILKKYPQISAWYRGMHSYSIPDILHQALKKCLIELTTKSSSEEVLNEIENETYSPELVDLSENPPTFVFGRLSETTEEDAKQMCQLSPEYKVLINFDEFNDKRLVQIFDHWGNAPWISHAPQIILDITSEDEDDQMDLISLCKYNFLHAIFYSGSNNDSRSKVLKLKKTGDAKLLEYVYLNHSQHFKLYFELIDMFKSLHEQRMKEREYIMKNWIETTCKGMSTSAILIMLHGHAKKTEEPSDLGDIFAKLLKDRKDVSSYISNGERCFYTLKM